MMFSLWHLGCSSKSEMIAALIIFGLIAGGYTIGLLAAAAAPVGYQDETGFHYGRQEGATEEEFPCGVPQPKLV